MKRYWQGLSAQCPNTQRTQTHQIQYSLNNNTACGDNAVLILLREGPDACGVARQVSGSEVVEEAANEVMVD
jgi:hypothetical protein